LTAKGWIVTPAVPVFKVMTMFKPSMREQFNVPLGWCSSGFRAKL